MTLSTGFLAWVPLRQLLCAALLLSIFLVVYRAMTARKRSLLLREGRLDATELKSCISIKKPTSPRSTRTGIVRAAVMWGISIFAAVMFGMVPVSNQLGSHDEVTKLNVHLLEVPQPMPDREYWYTEGSSPERKLAIFCHNPPFDEGQTLKSLTFKDMGDCWEIIHRNTDRDELTTLPITRDNP